MRMCTHGSLTRPGSSLETRWTVLPKKARSALERLLQTAYQPVPEQQQVRSRINATCKCCKGTSCEHIVVLIVQVTRGIDICKCIQEEHFDHSGHLQDIKNHRVPLHACMALLLKLEKKSHA